MQAHQREFRLTSMCRVLKVHRSGYYAWLREPLSPRAKSALTALIRMDDHRILWLSAPNRHRQCVQHQARLHACAHAPANDRTRVQIQHSSQIQPALMRSDVGDIRYPRVVWLIVLELTLQLIGYHLRRLAHLVPGSLVPPHRFDLRCTHQPGNTVFATRHTSFLEVTKDAGAAVDAHALVVELTNLRGQLLIGFNRWCKDNRLSPSMSRRGNCWDNAVAESFFSSLKSEQIKKRIYQTGAEAKSEIFDYIEGFYNRVRRHKHLDQLSPHEFERQRQTAL
jgi:putative transposase